MLLGDEPAVLGRRTAAIRVRGATETNTEGCALAEGGGP
jgi:hypothetical protein